jgi:hypothetical protein
MEQELKVGAVVLRITLMSFALETPLRNQNPLTGRVMTIIQQPQQNHKKKQLIPPVVNHISDKYLI